MDGRKKVIENHFKNNEEVNRKEFEPMVEWIKPESRVLDVGCGEGSFAKRLIEEKKCSVVGIDISSNAAKQARNKGIEVFVNDVDEGLSFDDKEFDYVVLGDVLEHVYRPKFVLEEAIRVGRKCIIASPNVAFILARLEILILGRFPKTPLFGYEWYNTQHIHLFSYKDFKGLLDEIDSVIVKKWFYVPKLPNFVANFSPNLFSIVFAVEITEKSNT